MSNETRQLSQYGLNQLKVWEGKAGSNGQPALIAYQDPAGVWTIGFGHTKDVKKGQVCTADEANSFLIDDLMPTCEVVDTTIKAPLSDNQFAALVCFAFNVGATAFQGSTLAKNLNTTPPDYDGVPGQLALWNKITVNGQKVVSKGLVNRRALETTLWLTPDTALKPSQVAVADPNAPILTRSDLRQVATTSATPEAPPTKVSQTKSGAGNLATIALGAAGAAASASQNASGVISSINSAFSGHITEKPFWLLFTTVISAAIIVTSVYVWWHQRQNIKNGEIK